MAPAAPHAYERAAVSTGRGVPVGDLCAGAQVRSSWGLGYGCARC